MSFLVSDIRSVVTGDAWHGPSWREVTSGLDSEDATRRVLPSAHTIYELVHHTAAWASEVALRLDGKAPSNPKEGDYPPPGKNVDESEWRRVLAQLEQAHEDLYAAIERFDARRLDERIGVTRDAPLGAGVSYRATIAGVLAHTAYHAGQAMMLRRAIQSIKGVGVD